MKEGKKKELLAWAWVASDFLYFVVNVKCYRMWERERRQKEFCSPLSQKFSTNTQTYPGNYVTNLIWPSIEFLWVPVSSLSGEFFPCPKDRRSLRVYKILLRRAHKSGRKLCSKANEAENKEDASDFIHDFYLVVLTPNLTSLLQSYETFSLSWSCWFHVCLVRKCREPVH